MLVAETTDGAAVEASLDLAAGDFRCPACKVPAVFKRGRVKVPHFGHAPGSDCVASEAESVRHLLAKRVLADEFRRLGYAVTFEETYRHGGRRVDVSVDIPVSLDRVERVAVEVQDSPISVDEIKRRMTADRTNGFIGTAWVFTGRRHDLLLPASAGAERRIPEEMRYLANRFGQGVFLLDAEAFAMSQVFFGTVVRDGSSSEWYSEEGEYMSEDYPDRVLRATKGVFADRVGFRLTCRPSRYHKPGRPDWAMAFADVDRASATEAGAR
jgi:hypothetical protein